MKQKVLIMSVCVCVCIPALVTRKANRIFSARIILSGESNGKLPLRTCTGCSVPEPYQSPDLALVSAQTGPRTEYL